MRWEFGIIGSLPAALRAQFPGIERIHRAHMEPVAWARVCIDRERGLLDVAVELPAPDLAVPRTSLLDDSVLLPQGSRLPATLGGEDRQLLGQVTGVDVRVDGETVAQLEYVPLVDGPVGVRVFVIDGRSFVDVGVGDPVAVPVLPEWVAPEPPEPPFDPAAPWAVTMEFVDVMEPNPTGVRTCAVPAVEQEGATP